VRKQPVADQVDLYRVQANRFLRRLRVELDASVADQCPDGGTQGIGVWQSFTGTPMSIT
jgi:hypothetical protein